MRPAAGGGRVVGAVKELGARLRGLKEDTPYSYALLARRVGVSRSALHRYCSGQGTPPEFVTVERFARYCGASREEMVGLHRLWVLADAVHRGRPFGGAGTGAHVGVGVGQGEFLPGEVAERSAPEACRTPWRGAVFRVTAVSAVAAAVLAVGVAVAVVAVMLGGADASPGGGGPGGEGTTRVLFSEECEGMIVPPRSGHCTAEVQRLLAGRGADVGVDAKFGPRTVARLAAFQALAGLSVSGIVDDTTKRALYQSDVTLNAVDPEAVAVRIQGVFTQNPEEALALARCVSLLDPLHVPRLTGIRTWGVFQLSDDQLARLGATPAQALDPEWNIGAAHRLWFQDGDFSAWPPCRARPGLLDGDGPGVPLSHGGVNLADRQFGA